MFKMSICSSHKHQLRVLDFKLVVFKSISHVISSHFESAWILYRHCELAELIIALILFNELSVVKSLGIDPACKSFNAVSFVPVEFRSAAELRVAAVFSATGFFRAVWILGLTEQLSREMRLSSPELWRDALIWFNHRIRPRWLYDIMGGGGPERSYFGLPRQLLDTKVLEDA